MRWLQNNQAHLLVVERARQDNLTKRTRRPSKTLMFGILVMTWGIIWLVSLTLYSLKSFSTHDSPEKSHDHKNLRKSSTLLKELKRPLHGDCYFYPEEQPGYGYLSGDCLSKQACSFRENVEEARDACLANPKCAGITYVPWEERYELRESPILHETFDGQRSYIKRCKGGLGSHAGLTESFKHIEKKGTIAESDAHEENDDEEFGQIEEDAPLPDHDTDEEEDSDETEEGDAPNDNEEETQQSIKNAVSGNLDDEEKEDTSDENDDGVESVEPIDTEGLPDDNSVI